MHLNGSVMAREDACVPVTDRGFLFADAVYEGLAVLDGRIVDFARHMARLERSLAEIGIENPHDRAEWRELVDQLIRENRVAEGFAYLQVTRGSGDSRNWVEPGHLTPTVFAFVRETTEPPVDGPPPARTLATVPDLRWARRDIKSTNLLAQVLAKRQAHERGCDDALLVNAEGIVTEVASRSFFAVVDGTLVTRPLSEAILAGVTREGVLDAARSIGVAVEERELSVEEVRQADEVFVTGSSTYVQPVVAIDGEPIGVGEPGPLTLRIRAAHLQRVRTGLEGST